MCTYGPSGFKTLHPPQSWSSKAQFGAVHADSMRFVIYSNAVSLYWISGHRFTLHTFFLKWMMTFDMLKLLLVVPPLEMSVLYAPYSRDFLLV